MAEKKGIGNVHAHHLDLRVLPENITKQQSGAPEWVDDTFLPDFLAMFSDYFKRFKEVMKKRKKFSDVAKFHIEDMDEADIDYSVVLHIDFEGADPKAKDWNYQYEYVIDWVSRVCAVYPFRFFPFFGFDPRRPHILDMLETNFKDRCFVGIKLYPATGFDPQPGKRSYSQENGDYYPHKYKVHGSLRGPEILENLKQMYAFAEKHNVPIMTHCAPSGTYRATVRSKEKYKNIWRYTNPMNFQHIAKKYGLRIGFAHMGGRIDKESDKKMAVVWRNHIFKLIELADEWTSKGRFFTDASYDIIHLINDPGKKVRLDANIKRFEDYLKNEVIGKYILFGSDWPLNIYKCSEKQYIDEYRKRLNKELQRKYFSDNIARFLFGESKKIPPNYVDFIQKECARENRPFIVPEWIKEENGEYFLR